MIYCTKYSILLMLFLIMLNGVAQTPFNKKFDIAKGAGAMYGIAYLDNSFYMTGAGIDSSFYVGPSVQNQKIELIKIDKNGNKLWDKRYGNDLLYYSFQFKTTPSKINSSLYFNGQFLDTLNKAHQYLFKFNEQGDSLLLVHYFENDTTIETFAGGCKITRDNNLILSGVVDSSFYNKFSQMYLMKTDTLGNILWWKTYGGSQYETCTNMDTTSDGGFILGGWTTSFGGADQDPYIVKTDSNGNFQWQKTINSNSFEDWSAVVLSTKDGGILAVTTEVQKEDVNNKFVKIFFNKYDISGNLLWRKSVGDTLLQAPVFTVKEASNGDVVVIGNHQFYNLIIKINANGDSLLMNTVYYLEGNTCFFPQQYGFDLALIDSGGYAIAGFVIPSPANINNTQDAWLSTYDSLGCQLPNAPTNLTATVNYVGNDTLIELNWQHNSASANEVFILERYWNELYTWRILNDECTFTLSGNTFITSTNYTDTLHQTIAKYRVLVVDTLTHLTSCYSNIAVVDLTTSVDEKTINNNAVKVYPNPNNGTFTLLLTNANQAIFSIFNLSGQLLQQRNVNKTAEIDISNQPNGMYFYQVNLNNTIVTGKIIKN